MQVTYSEDVKQAGDYAHLQRATEQLQEMLGSSASSVVAAWDRRQNERGCESYILKLSDSSVSASSEFASPELHDGLLMRFRLHRIWAELLKIRGDRELQELGNNGNGSNLEPTRMSPELLEWAIRQFNDEETLAGIEEIRQTGGLKFEDFIHELEAIVAPHE